MRETALMRHLSEYFHLLPGHPSRWARTSSRYRAQERKAAFYRFAYAWSQWGPKWPSLQSRRIGGRGRIGVAQPGALSQRQIDARTSALASACST
jgi:hypothetical protein